MKSDIRKLYRISQKNERLIIGLMSGTSLDGLDIALVHVSGRGPTCDVRLKAHVTKPYPPAFHERIAMVFAKKHIDLELLCGLHPWIGEQHAAMVREVMEEWDINISQIDLVASHGQTIYHAPKRLHNNEFLGNSTLQIGDADHMARRLGIITISDFRQKHIAGGGEGAPLALYGDYIMFSSETESRILLNLGGIANLTYLPAGGGFGDSLSSDVGPGNTILDACARAYFDRPFDRDARMALLGDFSHTLFQMLIEHPFFGDVGPKTTGPETFNMAFLERALAKLPEPERMMISHQDIMNTLTHLTVWGIEQFLQINTIDICSCKFYVSGGGIHNPLMMKLIQSKFKTDRVSTTQQLGIDPDAKEAVLFAILANELVCGDSSWLNHPRYPAVGMGKVSLPG